MQAYQLGQVVSSTNVQEIKRVLKELLSEHRKGGIKLSSKKDALRDFDGRKLMAKLNDILLGCLPHNGTDS